MRSKREDEDLDMYEGGSNEGSCHKDEKVESNSEMRIAIPEDDDDASRSKMS